MVMAPVMVAVLVAGCAPWIAANPQFASDSARNSDASSAGVTEETGPPQLSAPRHDLLWRECTASVFDTAKVAAPPDVLLECAYYDADLDPITGAKGTLSMGVIRAKSSDTPPEAGPLVFTTGSDIPSSRQLPVWLSRAGTELLKHHPIVSLDRRGMGMSSAIDCRDVQERQGMADQAQYQDGDDPVAELGVISTAATTSCTDIVAGASAYDTVRAAEDIEQLRRLWDVPAIALMGVGNGAQIALAYAGAHPDKVARLILDSPGALGISAEAAAKEQIEGQQAALAAFAAQCLALSCALGPDPQGAVNALLSAAREGRGPGAVSVSVLTNAIVTALAYPQGDQIGSTLALAQTLAAARDGDIAPLNELIAEAAAIRGTDGQFVNSCSDAFNRPTPNRVRELVVEWNKVYPQFGAVGALSMVDCLSWPSSTAPEQPEKLDVDVVVLGVLHDPIVGDQGVSAAVATIINAGAASKRVMWQATGHGAGVYSACTLAPMVSYLADGSVPDTDIYCPA